LIRQWLNFGGHAVTPELVIDTVLLFSGVAATV